MNDIWEEEEDVEEDEETKRSRREKKGKKKILEKIILCLEINFPGRDHKQITRTGYAGHVALNCPETTPASELYLWHHFRENLFRD